MTDTALVCVSGGYCARLCDRLRGEGVSLSRLEISEKSREFSFSVRKKDLSKTFAILDEMCYTYNVPLLSSRTQRLKSVLARLGFILALAVFAVPVMLSRGYVWRISVSGNSAIPDKVIESALEGCGVKVGARLGAFDGSAAEKAVRDIDGIKLASVYTEGTTVKVEVYENEPIAPPVSFSDTDILSEYDATVTRVVTREGTALVEPGQNVFRGTALIGAYRLDAEDNKLPSRASGKVYGKVSFTKSVLVPRERYEQVVVREYERTFLTVFGLRIGKSVPSGAGIYTQTHSSRFDAFIPVTLTHVKVTETELRKVTETDAELAGRIERETVADFIDSHVTSGISSRTHVSDAGGGVVRVSVFIESETLIGGI